MRVVCFVSFLQRRVVAKQIIGCDVEMAGDTQKLVLTDGAMPFLNSTQGASVNAYNFGELTLLHIVVCPEVGNSLSNLLIAHNPHPDFAILTNFIIRYSNSKMQGGVINTQIS